jgi:GAF domain-containing protein
LLSSVLPVLVLTLVALGSLLLLGFQSGVLIRESLQTLNTRAEESLRRLGEQYIQTVARDAARQVAIYISAHPDATIADLQADETFLQIIAQPVGETGYIAMHEVGTGVVRFHANPALVNKDLTFLKEKIPTFWVIFEASLSGKEVSGYYDWVEPDGSIRPKYMCITPVPVPVQGTYLMLGATTYIDEFSRPVVQMRAMAEELSRQYRSLALRQVVTTGGISLLILMLLTTGVFIWSRRAVGEYVTPLADLAQVAPQIGKGERAELSPVLLQRPDEMGVLAQALVQASKQIQELVHTLEQRVAERTADLARRTAQLEAAAYVARRAAEIRDVDTLLNETVRLISDRFGFYHAGIFLVDDAREYAVLRAASSEGGQRMLARGHRLAVGKVGIVGYVADTGRPRIALDVGVDAVFFDNPDLPLTRSEMALPLKVGERVIGVLDVQSEEPAAFTDEDVSVLQTMADQIALAIENARLLEESRRALEELQVAYGERIRLAWERAEGIPPALVYDRVAITPVETQPPAPFVEEALREGRLVALSEPDDGRAVIAAPLRLHDRVIGAIALEETDGARTWTEDDIALVQAVSEQVALALESARLYQMEQRRRFVADTLQEIARVVGSTLDLQEVTHRLLDQLERLIPFDVAVIHLLRGEGREIVGGRGVDMEAMQRWLEKQPPVSQDPLLAEVLRTRAPVVIADTRTDPRWKRRGARSGMAVPLVLGEEVIGFLLMDHSQPGMYTEETTALAGAVAAQAAVAVQNARLYEEARRTARQMQSLYEISRALSATLDEQATIQTILQAISRLTECEFAIISLVDEPTRTIGINYGIYRNGFDRYPEWIDQTRYPLDHPDIIADIYRTGRTEILTGWDDRFNREIWEKYGHERYLRVFMPIRIQQKVIGVLEVSWDRDRKERVAEDELRLLSSLMDQAAIAIQNVRLFEEARLRAEELAVLNELGQALTARLDVQQVLEEAYRGASRLLDTTNFYIALYDPQTQTVHFPLALEENQRRPYQSRPFASGLTEYIIRNRKPVLIEEDVPARLQEMGVELIGRTAQSWLGVPLIVGEQVLGVMAVQSYTTPRAYDRHDLDLLTAIASQVAIAIQNARSYEEARRRAERERIIREVTTRIWASPDLESILQTTARELGRVLGTSHAVVRLGSPSPDDDGAHTAERR